MRWIKIDLSSLRGDVFLRCDPVQRATWLCLLGYCADQESSGRICDCAAWPNRTWSQLAGVELDEVRDVCGLYWWEGDDLVVWGYDLAAERSCQAAAERGKAAAAKRWQGKKTEMPTGAPDWCQPAHAAGAVGAMPRHSSHARWARMVEQNGADAVLDALETYAGDEPKYTDVIERYMRTDSYKAARVKTDPAKKSSL